MYTRHQQPARIISQPVTVGGNDVTPVQSVRNLDVLLDDQLTMEIYARNVVRSHLRQHSDS